MREGGGSRVNLVSDVEINYQNSIMQINLCCLNNDHTTSFSFLNPHFVAMPLRRRKEHVIRNT